MTQQGTFDFSQLHALTANLDHVIAATMEHEAARVIVLGIISGAAPTDPVTCHKTSFGFGRIAPISLCYRRAIYQQLTSNAFSSYYLVGVVYKQKPGALAGYSDRDWS